MSKGLIDSVFNTPIVIIINSRFRDTTTYPIPNYYQIDLPIVMNSIGRISLLQFTLSNVILFPQVLYISVDPFRSNNYNPGYPISAPLFTVTNRTTDFAPFTMDYEIEYTDAQRFFVTKDQKQNVQSLFIQIFDDQGNPFLIPDHTMKLIFYCYA